MDYQPNANPYAGRELSRPVSRSLVAPQTLTGYTEFFRQNSQREDGWMQAKFSSVDDTPQQTNHQHWTRLWFSFDNEECALKYGRSPAVPAPEMTCIPMSTVVSLKTMGATKGAPATMIGIMTDQQKITLRPPTPTDMNRWTFCFQKSVALVLTSLTRDAQRASLGVLTSSPADYDRLRRDAAVYRGLIDGSGIASNSSSSSSGNSHRSPRNTAAANTSAAMAVNRAGSGIAEFGRQSAFDASTAAAGASQPLMARSPPIPIMMPMNYSAYPVTLRDSSNSSSTGGGAVDRYNTASSLNALGALGFLQSSRNSLYSGDATHSNENLVGSTQGKLNGSPLLTTVSSATAAAESIAITPAASSSSLNGGSVTRSQSDEMLFFTQQQEQQYQRAGVMTSRSSFRHEASSPDSPIVAHIIRNGSGDFPLTGDGDSDNDNNNDNDDRQLQQQQRPSAEYDNSDRSRGGSRCSADDFIDDSYMMFDLEEVASSSKQSHSNTGSAVNGGNSVDAKTSISRIGNYPPSSSSSSSSCSASGSSTFSAAVGSQPQSLLTALLADGGATKATITRDRGNISSFLKWECGYCTELGPKKTNEDTFECRALNSITDVESNKDTALSSSSASSSSRTVVNLLSSAARVGSSTLKAAAATGKSTIEKTTTTAASAAVEEKSILRGGGAAHTGGYFAVYDGHAGVQAADFLEAQLFDQICSDPNFSSDINAAISNSCKLVDNLFLDICTRDRVYAGTTALGVFLINTKLVVFNIGDCQAVLCSNGVAIELNDPHKPDREDESERIHEAGGWLDEEREIQFRRLHHMDLADPMVWQRARAVGNFVTTTRVCGDLAVSRSIGDPDLKRIVPGEVNGGFFNWPDDHDHTFQADLIIPDPEFVEHEISSSDEFLILASDGLWDVISTSEGVSIAREAFLQGKDAMQVADHLCELALRLGVYDNVTAVVVKFVHSAAADDDAGGRDAAPPFAVVS